MKYGIISDIHSNLSALVNVVDELKREKVDKIFCCGDIVGYCAEPNECIEIVKKERIMSILGNHDAGVLGILELSWFNEDAKEAIEINKRLISKDNIKFLKSLKKELIFDNILFVHGSIEDPLQEYLDNIFLLKRNIEFLNQNICFCGHTHRPFIYSYDSKTNKDEIQFPNNRTSRFRIESSKKYIINVGSVGQPRDANNCACFVIYNQESGILEFKRIKYNISITQQKMFNLQMPEFLIKRLEFGE